MEQCYDCGKNVRKPIYAPKHEETVQPAARCCKCHEKRVRQWERMNKTKREVSYNGSTYKVRSNHIKIPDFVQMERLAILTWLNKHTYPRGYSKSANPLQGLGAAIKLDVR